MTRKTVLCVLCALALIACKKEVGDKWITATGEASEITPYSAVLTCYAQTFMYMHRTQKGLAVSQDPEASEDGWRRYYLEEGDPQSEYSFEILALEPSTTYYYRSFIAYETSGSSSAEYHYGEIRSFTTLGSEVTLTDETVFGVTKVLMRAKVNLPESDFGRVSKVWFMFSPSGGAVETNQGEPYEAELQPDGSFEVLKTDLMSEKYYYCRAVASVDGELYYGKVIAFRTISFSPSEDNPTDMGLSVDWGRCNVGASSPDGRGYYFAWGETTVKESYTSENYQYSGDSDVLPLSADAAHQALGGKWRMPTFEEFTELMDNSIVEYGLYGFMRGILIISKINNNAIFLPALGCYSGESNPEDYSLGLYWTSSRFSTGDGNVDSFAYYYDTDWKISESWSMCFGASVRAVCEK